MHNDFHSSKSLKCPWCTTGKIFVEEDSKGRISNVCNVCGRVYIANLTIGRTEKSKARASPNAPRKPNLVPHTTE